MRKANIGRSDFGHVPFANAFVGLVRTMMNVAGRYERRSQEAPMDFEFTDKNRDVIPVDSPFRTPVKREHAWVVSSVVSQF